MTWVQLRPCFVIGRSVCQHQFRNIDEFGYVVLQATWTSEIRISYDVLNTLRTGLLNCLNARSRGLTFRDRASCI